MWSRLSASILIFLSRIIELLSWGEQLAGVLDIVKRQAAAKAGKEVDEMELTMMKTMLQQQIEKESDAFFATRPFVGRWHH